MAQLHFTAAEDRYIHHTFCMKTRAVPSVSVKAHASSKTVNTRVNSLVYFKSFPGNLVFTRR